MELNHFVFIASIYFLFIYSQIALYEFAIVHQRYLQFDDIVE